MKPRRIVEIMGPGLLLQECLYGFIMALIFITAAQTHIVRYSSSNELITLIIGMNFTWGAIDMVIFFLVDKYDQRRYVRIIREKEYSEDDTRKLIHENLSGTIVDVLTEDDEDAIVDRIIASRIEPEEQLKSERRGMLISGLFCFIVTILTTIPVIIPLMLIGDAHTAVFAASAVAATCLFFIGYYLAPYIGANKWSMGIGIALLAWTITILATFTGG